MDGEEPSDTSTLTLFSIDVPSTFHCLDRVRFVNRNMSAGNSHEV